MSKVQLEFHNSTLSGEEEKKAELTGMLALAADFIGSNKIGKSDKLVRISKLNFPMYLFKTKTNQYLPINPYKLDSFTLPIMQLPTLTEIKEFCSDHDNLNLNKLYGKMMEFQVDKTDLVGSYTEKEMNYIKSFLKAPKSTRTDFTILSPVRSKEEIKSDLEGVNEKVYSKTALKKAIEDRLKIIEDSLVEESSLYSSKLKERNDYWVLEIKNKNVNLQKQLKQRDTQLEKDIKELEKTSVKQIEENIHNFLAGVAKNIRRDEKPIEKSIQELEKSTDAASKSEDIPKIERVLKQLSDQTDTFRAAIGFAERQVRTTKQKEGDVRANQEIELEILKSTSDKDKTNLRDEADRIEKTRDIELKELKTDTDITSKRLIKFKDVKNEWSKDIATSLESKAVTMLSPNDLGEITGQFIELLIPSYVFQYSKKGDLISVVVPPLYLPDNFKKTGKDSYFAGDKTVFYNLVGNDSKKYFSEWFEKAILQNRDLQSLISSTPNLLDNPSHLSSTFLTSRSLMTEKLKANKKKFDKVNGKLTEVFSE